MMSKEMVKYFISYWSWLYDAGLDMCDGSACVEERIKMSFIKHDKVTDIIMWLGVFMVGLTAIQVPFNLLTFVLLFCMGMNYEYCKWKVKGK